MSPRRPAPPASDTPRLIPMKGDSLSPAVRAGDILVVLPTDRFSGDGLYALEVFPGGLEVRRCEWDFAGKIRCAFDNPAYAGKSLTLAELDTLVVGRVVAVCHTIAPELLSSFGERGHGTEGRRA